jgi:hypothetical protein
MRRIPMLLAVGVGLASGAYTIVYLYRWEWNRAVIAGLFFVAAELALATGVLIARLRRLEDRLEHLGHSAPPAADDGARPIDRIRGSAPPPSDHFAWLRDGVDRMNVFLPVLLGAGVLASGLAWIIEHLARTTAVPALERRLAVRLEPLALPSGGLLGPPRPAGDARATPSDRRNRVRWLRTTALVLAAAVAASLALDFLADRIQTRPDMPTTESTTIVDVDLRGAIALQNPERAITHLWGACTGPDVFRTRQFPEPTFTYGADGAVRVVVSTALGRNARARLVGCLNDTTLNRVQATVTDVTLR